MPADTEGDSKPRSGIHMYLIVPGIVFALAFGYVGWIFFRDGKRIATSKRRRQPKSVSSLSGLLKAWAETASTF
jgi:hypothetical protein